MTDSPWRFLTPLSALSPDDRRLIELTRSDELHLVNQMVGFSRVSLLYAFSGNGKTSLINAGIVPFCQGQGYSVFRTRPRPPWSQSDPALAFKECVLRDLPAALLTAGDERLLAALAVAAERESGEDPEILRGLLQRLEKLLKLAPSESVDFAREKLPGYAEKRLVEFLGDVAGLLGRNRRLLLICDQFEELFVHYGNTEKLEHFVEQLGEVWASDSLSLHLLFSLREDWVGSMIAFRRAIPEIFNNYFRLSPITAKRAEQVLTLPFARDDGGFPPAALQRILTDLAACYGGSERQADSTEAGERSQAADAFIELPALQIVASRMWETRTTQPAPFSVAHYQAIAPPQPPATGLPAGASPGPVAPAAGSAGAPDTESAALASPAQFVLGHYLIDAVRRTGPAGTAGDERLAELRLDCLYLFTDGERHRRAGNLARLERELRQVRPAALELPPADADAIRDALEPLVQEQLVHRVEGGAATDEYELAHDFAVRAVVGEWRQLDRRRSREVGRLIHERRQKEQRLTKLEGRLMGLLLVLFFLGTGALLWAAAAVAQGQLHSLYQRNHLPGPLTLAAGLFCAVAVLGLVARNRRSQALGLAGALVAIGAGALPDRTPMLWLLGIAVAALLVARQPALLARLRRRLRWPKRQQRSIPGKSWGMRITFSAWLSLVAIIGIGTGVAWFTQHGAAGSNSADSCRGLLGRPLRVGVVTWPGYAGGIVANNGFKPNQDSIYFKQYNLCVQFMLMEDVDARSKAFVGGGENGVDIVWSTVDFWANELPGFLKNGVKARAIMQVDWSRGGDAIVADNSTKRIEDLYQKRISLALFTPSQWLLEYNIQNSSLDEAQQNQIVKALVGKNASPDARADFVAGRVDAAVVWEPDVAEALSKRPNSHVLVSSKQARKLIADVMLAREDFIHDHPDVIQAFVDGWVTDGTDTAYRNTDTVVKLLMENESLYKDLGPEVTRLNLSTVRWANLADNTEMFNLDGKDRQPLFDRLFTQAGTSWAARGYIAAPAEPGVAKDDSFLRKIYQARPVGRIPDDIPAATIEVAQKAASSSKPIAVNFAVNSDLLDTAAQQAVDKISLLPTVFAGGAYIRVEGNTDNTGNRKRNRVLSERRAKAVVDYLVTKYGLPRTQFITVGNGPDKPIASNASAAGRAANARVEVSVIQR